MEIKAVTESNRKEWIDLVRVFAIFLVVLCHSVDGIYSFNVKEMAEISVNHRIFVYALFTFSRLASSLFLTMSGYLLLDRAYDKDKIFRFWKKRWLHLLICTVIWFLIYELFLIIFFNAKTPFMTVIYDLIFFHQVNMMNVWYMPAILGIYVLIPFVAIALQKTDPNMMIFPVLFYFVFSFVFIFVRTINAILGQPALSMQISAGFSGGVYCFYLICGYLVKKGAFRSIKTIWLFVIIIASVTLGTGLHLWSFSQEISYKIWRDNPCILIASVALFEAFSRIRHVIFPRLIKELASYSFAIYLLHVIVRQIFIDQVAEINIARPLKTLIIWALMLSISYLSAWLICRIPKIGNYLFYRR